MRASGTGAPRLGRGAWALLAALAWAGAAGAADKPASKDAGKQDKLATRLPATLAVGKLAYEAKGVIKVMDLATEKIESYDLPEKMEYPSWSADGKRFAYSSGFGVSILDIAGQSFTAITPPGQDAVEPTWSPDGQRLAYEARGENAGLYIYDARLKDKPPARIKLGLAASDAAWNPKTDTLAFVAAVNGVDQIFVMDLGCLKEASCDSYAKAVTADGKGSREPAWSADGTQLAFERDAGDGKGTGIFVAKADGSLPRRVSPKNSDDHAPSWGGNAALVFERTSGDVTALVVVKADGTSTTRVLHDGARQPAWWQPAQP
jgi:Tol biopolymer transport system component